MKVAFWSNGNQSSGVTSNLACISIVSAYQYSYKAIIFENHHQKNKLEDFLFYNRDPRIRKLYYSSYTKGIANLYKEHRNGEYRMPTFKDKNIKDESLEILRDSLYYLPTDYYSNEFTYEFNLYQSIKVILDELEEFADITFIDTSNNNLSSKVILEEADLIVVNLTQNLSLIEHFFENYSSILYKCVFLISSYHKQSNLNLKKISKLTLIDKSQMTAIPFNIEYQEALHNGTVVEFIARNYKCDRTNPNYVFVNQVKKAVHMIVNNSNLNSARRTN